MRSDHIVLALEEGMWAKLSQEEGSSYVNSEQILDDVPPSGGLIFLRTIWLVFARFFADL